MLRVVLLGWIGVLLATSGAEAGGRYRDYGKSRAEVIAVRLGQLTTALDAYKATPSHTNRQALIRAMSPFEVPILTQQDQRKVARGMRRATSPFNKFLNKRNPLRRLDLLEPAIDPAFNLGLQQGEAAKALGRGAYLKSLGAHIRSFLP